MLGDPSAAEREILGAIPYQANEAVLHTDSSLMPRRRTVWSSWNFHLAEAPPQGSTVTYWMNNLQRLGTDRDYFLTLNRGAEIDPGQVIERFSYDHPMFTAAGIAAQARHAEISNAGRRTHYCGAYWGWGFHEDGVVSALRACAGIPAADAAPAPRRRPVAADLVGATDSKSSDTESEALAA
jgi:predicted NAD/FAD-binding protein